MIIYRYLVKLHWAKAQSEAYYWTCGIVDFILFEKVDKNNIIKDDNLKYLSHAGVVC